MTNIPLIKSFCLFTLLLFSLSSRSQTTVNGYANITSIAGAVINVNNVNEGGDTFEDGEYVIVMQMQGNVIGTNTTNAASFGNLSAIGQTGKFEVARILSHTEIAGLPNTITLTGALTNAYSVSANSQVQMITFNQLALTNYTTSFNIGCLAWNGTIGGVCAIYIPGSLTLNHNITVDGKGFLGGSKNTPNGYTTCDNATYITAIATRYAGKGEGIYKNTTAGFTGARGKILNGGGGGNDVNAGGGGGGNYSAGGDGGLGWVPAGTGCSPSAGGLGGIALNGSIGPSCVYMGGGGGGGHENDGVGTPGGSGGGIVLLKTGTLITTGACGGRSITANGTSAGNASNDGCGGGGAAGSIVLQVNAVSAVAGCPLVVRANAGNGGSSVTSGVHGGGGGGGQGAICISLPLPIANSSFSTAPGIGGSSCIGCTVSVGGQDGGGPNNGGVIPNVVGVLPLDLVSFNAENMQNHVLLSWATASEKSTDYFFIERSNDALSWTEIAKVKAAENSSTKLYYESLDEQPLNGISYYRIKIIDLDQTVSYSDIKIIERDRKEPFVVFYPNPTSDVLHIATSYKSNQIIYVLTDITGKVIQVPAEINSDDKITLDLSVLSKGIYFISVKAPDGSQYSSNKIIFR